MKYLVIFCIFFISTKADFSPRRLLSCEADAISWRSNNGNEIALCVKNVLNISNIDCDHNEVNEFSKVSHEHQDLISQIKYAAEFSVTLCNIKFADFTEEYFQDLRENSTFEKYLDCYKSELKRLQPKHEIVKDFNEEIICDSEELFKSLDLKNNPKNLIFYNSLKFSSCTLNEFLQINNFYVLLLEKILMVKSSNFTADEIGKNFKHKISKVIETRLKCILGSWMIQRP